MADLFFWVSKLAWLFISPDSLLIILLLSSTYLLWRNKLKWGKRFLGLTTFLFLLVALFPVGEWILYPLEKQYKANPQLDRVDGIIVLGGAEDAVASSFWKQPVLHEAAERFTASVALQKRFPTAELVFTGGSGRISFQQYKGADVAKQLYMDLGLDSSKITFESESRNTVENVVLSKKLVSPKENEKWVLVTTGWHMPRSMGIFCKNNWDVIPYPVDFYLKSDDLLRFQWDFSGNLENLTIGVKEWIGLTVYKLTGKSC